MHTITVHGIPNCDTVKRARAWLGERGVNHRFHDFRKDGVPAEALDGWIARLGWERLLNRQGTTWRRLP
jgi:Spx/MgsR family transcriptional regulator